MLYQLNKRKVQVLGFVFTFLVQDVVWAQSNNFDLQDCIQYALQNHPNSTIYANEGLIQVQKVKESKGAYLPDVYGDVNLDYNIKLQTSIIPAGSLGEEETLLQMGNKYSTGAYVQLDQKIYDRSTMLDIKASKVDKEISDINVLQANEEIIYNSAVYYYQLLALSEERMLLEENKLQYQKLSNILKLQFEQGVIKKTDYNQVIVNLNNIEADIAVNSNSYELTMNQLKNAIGMDLNVSLEINDSIKYDEEFKIPDSDGLELNKRFDYQVDQLNIKKQEIDVQQKNSDFQPTLSAYGKYGANVYGSDFSEAFTDWFDYSAIGLKLNIPIFSGFQKNSRLQQSKLSYSNLKLTQELNNRSYQLEYQNAAQELFTSYTNLQKNKDNLSLAQEVFDAKKVEYQEGKSTLSDFLNATYSFKESQTNYINSLLDYLQSRIEFEKSKGTLSAYVSNLK